MLLNEQFLQENGVKDYIVQEKFHSRKNDVYKIKLIHHDGSEDVCMVKGYTDPIASQEMEVHLLTSLIEKGLKVPKLNYVGEDQLIMEFINGPTLFDVISELENEIKENPNFTYQLNYQLIKELCLWLKDFYSISKEVIGKDMIFGDMSLRNFIVTDGIYGVDFENCREGYIEEDAGRLCACILTFQPIFTPWKISFVKELFQIFTKEFHYSSRLIIREMEKELLEINKRSGFGISEEILSIIPDEIAYM